jgi:hypothetical protein
LVGLKAVTPVSSRVCVSAHFLATDQVVPFQCSAYPVSWLTAQTSVAAGALTAPSVPVSPPGRAAACHLEPFQCSATGVPAVYPLG